MKYTKTNTMFYVNLNLNRTEKHNFKIFKGKKIHGNLYPVGIYFKNKGKINV